MLNRDEKGFVGIVFLAIALISIVVASVAAMSRGGSSGIDDQTRKTAISTVLKQAADIKLAADRMMIAGVDPLDISLDNTVGTGLFDTTPGARYAVRPIPPAGFASADTRLAPSAQYTLATYMSIPNIGANLAPDDQAGYDIVLTLLLSSLQNCQAINKTLYGDSLSAAPGASTVSAMTWEGNGSETERSTASNYAGRPEGCFKTSDGKYMYYKVLVER